jgi:hypothetical protein
MPLSLDQFQRTIEAGSLPADAVATVLADVTRYVLAQGGVELDLGDRVRPGGEPWFVTLARESRDDDIRILVETNWPGVGITDQIGRLCAAFRKFDRGWSHGRFRDPSRLSIFDCALFRIFSSIDVVGPIPMSDPQLRKILGSGKSLLELENQVFLISQVS